MASLSAHLRRADDHGRLGFHSQCPQCRTERLSGRLPVQPLQSAADAGGPDPQARPRLHLRGAGDGARSRDGRAGLRRRVARTRGVVSEPESQFDPGRRLGGAVAGRWWWSAGRRAGRSRREPGPSATAPVTAEAAPSARGDPAGDGDTVLRTAQHDAPVADAPVAAPPATDATAGTCGRPAPRSPLKRRGRPTRVGSRLSAGPGGSSASSWPRRRVRLARPPRRWRRLRPPGGAGVARAPRGRGGRFFRSGSCRTARRNSRMSSRAGESLWSIASDVLGAARRSATDRPRGQSAVGAQQRAHRHRRPQPAAGRDEARCCDERRTRASAQAPRRLSGAARRRAARVGRHGWPAAPADAAAARLERTSARRPIWSSELRTQPGVTRPNTIALISPKVVSARRPHVRHGQPARGPPQAAGESPSTRTPTSARSRGWHPTTAARSARSSTCSTTPMVCTRRRSSRRTSHGCRPGYTCSARLTTPTDRRRGTDRYGELVAFLATFYDVVLLDVGTGSSGRSRGLRSSAPIRSCSSRRRSGCVRRSCSRRSSHLRHDHATVAINRSFVRAPGDHVIEDRFRAEHLHRRSRSRTTSSSAGMLDSGTYALDALGRDTDSRSSGWVWRCRSDSSEWR